MEKRSSTSVAKRLSVTGLRDELQALRERVRLLEQNTADLLRQVAVLQSLVPVTTQSEGAETPQQLDLERDRNKAGMEAELKEQER